MAEPYVLTQAEQDNLKTMMGGYQGVDVGAFADLDGNLFGDGAWDFSGVDLNLFGDMGNLGAGLANAPKDKFDMSNGIQLAGAGGPLNMPNYGDPNTFPSYEGLNFDFDFGDFMNMPAPKVDTGKQVGEENPPLLGEEVEVPVIEPEPTPVPTIEDPYDEPDLGYDPISGAPVGTGPQPDQSGDLPPNYVPPPNSRDWLGHVMTDDAMKLLPNQLERSGPIRRVANINELFNNPVNNSRSNVPTTAMGAALRGGGQDG